MAPTTDGSGDAASSQHLLAAGLSEATSQQSDIPTPPVGQFPRPAQHTASAGTTGAKARIATNMDRRSITSKLYQSVQYVLEHGRHCFESERFRLLSCQAEIVFERSEAGDVSGLVLHQAGNETVGRQHRADCRSERRAGPSSSLGSREVPASVVMCGTLSTSAALRLASVPTR